MRPLPRKAALAAAALSALCWGLATVMSKGALERLPPITLLVVQLASSVLFLWTLILVRGTRRGELRDALGVAWLGLLEPGVAYALGLAGLARTEAGAAALIGSSEAIMIAVLATILLQERLSRLFFPLSAVAIAGLTLAAGVDGLGSGEWLGNGLIVAATLTAAFYVTLSGRLVGDRDPILVVGCQHLVAGAFALLLLLFEVTSGATATLGELPSSLWVLAIASGIVQYALAFTFYLAAMRGLAASIVGAFLYLAPVVSLAGAAIFLGEMLSLQQMIGAAMAIGALLLLSRMRAEEGRAKARAPACAAGGEAS